MRKSSAERTSPVLASPVLVVVVGSPVENLLMQVQVASPMLVVTVAEPQEVVRWARTFGDGGEGGS